MMNRPHTILLADRNPRIRNFIQRELNAEGHRVVTAESGEQLRDWLDKPIHIDVLVIDPDMPGIDSAGQLLELFSKRPDLPVVFHCLGSDHAGMTYRSPKMTFVEKSGDSVDSLKRHLQSLFRSPPTATQNRRTPYRHHNRS